MSHQFLCNCSFVLRDPSHWNHDDVIKWKTFPRNWPLCGEFTGPGEFPTQRPVTRSFDVFFDLRLNKRLSKQTWGWWFETQSWSLWRQCNVVYNSAGLACLYATTAHRVCIGRKYALPLVVQSLCQYIAETFLKLPCKYLSPAIARW